MTATDLVAGLDPARPFLQKIAAGFPGSPHRLHVDCDPGLQLRAQELAAIGVIVGEGISNALSHAFPAGREGDVWVRLAEDRGRLRLSIRDNGIGIPDLGPDERGGRGLIAAAASRLGGYARLGSAPFGGGEVSVVFTPGR